MPPPLASDPADAPPSRHALPENFGEQTRRLLNERAAAAVQTNNTNMFVVGYRTAEAEPPLQLDHFVGAALYIKLKATLEVVFVLGWGFLIQQYQFNELDGRIPKLEKSQNVNKSTEETAVELDGGMSIDAKLIGNFITQQVAAAMAKKTKQYENKIEELEKGGKDGVSGESSKKRNEGRWTRFQ